MTAPLSPVVPIPKPPNPSPKQTPSHECSWFPWRWNSLRFRRCAILCHPFDSPQRTTSVLDHTTAPFDVLTHPCLDCCNFGNTSNTTDLLPPTALVHHRTPPYHPNPPAPASNIPCVFIFPFQICHTFNVFGETRPALPFPPGTSTAPTSPALRLHPAPLSPPLVLPKPRHHPHPHRFSLQLLQLLPPPALHRPWTLLHPQRPPTLPLTPRTCEIAPSFSTA